MAQAKFYCTHCGHQTNSSVWYFGYCPRCRAKDSPPIPWKK